MRVLVRCWTSSKERERKEKKVLHSHTYSYICREGACTGRPSIDTAEKLIQEGKMKMQEPTAFYIKSSKTPHQPTKQLPSPPTPSDPRVTTYYDYITIAASAKANHILRQQKEWAT